MFLLYSASAARSIFLMSCPSFLKLSRLVFAFVSTSSSLGSICSFSAIARRDRAIFTLFSASFPHSFRRSSSVFLMCSRYLSSSIPISPMLFLSSRNILSSSDSRRTLGISPVEFFAISSAISISIRWRSFSSFSFCRPSRMFLFSASTDSNVPRRFAKSSFNSGRTRSWTRSIMTLKSSFFPPRPDL